MNSFSHFAGGAPSSPSRDLEAGGAAQSGWNFFGAGSDDVEQQPLHLEQTHLTRRRLAMAHARLGRTNGQRLRSQVSRVNCCQRTRLRWVAQRCACAMHLQRPDLGRSQRTKRHHQQPRRAPREASEGVDAASQRAVEGKPQRAEAFNLQRAPPP